MTVALQVEIERINEEIRAELEYSAMTEPISHPIMDYEENVDAEADILEGVLMEAKPARPPPSYATEIYASNKQTNICIQNAVTHLTAQAAQS